MASLQDRIRFLRDCYRADRRTGGVLDVFGSKVEHVRFLEGTEQVFTGRLNPLPVPRREFGRVARAAQLYRREKSLFYGAFLLVGSAARTSDEVEETSRWPATICAPLVLCPADLADDSEYPESQMPLHVQRDEERVNFIAWTVLLGDEDRALEVTEGLVKHWPDRVDAPGMGEELAELLESLADRLDTSALRRFPDLMGRKEVRFEARRAARSGRIQVLPAAVVGLAVESLETRGVLHGLSAMATDRETSEPVRKILGDGSEDEGLGSLPEPQLGAWNDTVPAILSTAQRKVVAAACQYPVSVVVGPPGTGKSFTLASAALDQVARGHTVLIASRSQQALDVVAEKVEDLLSDRSILLEGGRRKRLRALKERLQHLLRGGLGADPAGDVSLEELRRRLARVDKDLVRLEDRMKTRAFREATWGEEEIRSRQGLTGWWGALVQAFRGQRLRRLPAYWDVLREYEGLLDLRIHRAASLLRASIHRRRAASLTRDRRQLQRFLSALRARHSSRQDRLFTQLDLSLVLAAFPLWTVRFADIHRVLPHAPDLFDLVMIDEATQCDMATALPTLLRGRRLVVTGDPKQLRHVSFLSRDRQRSLAGRNGLTSSEAERLDYRGESLLDLALDTVRHQDQAIFLDEHFRSTPELIRFSNREFYQGSLRVMTKRPETVERRSLFLRRVEGARHPDGHNPVEAELLIREVFEYVERTAEESQDRLPSVGILSPFRAQVDHLGDRLAQDLPLSALERHCVRVGTPYAFQGEERDAMFLSLALDDDSPTGAFRYLERADVFNVAVTRARNLQVVFHSFDAERRSRDTLLGRYLAAAHQPLTGESPHRPPASDDFLRDVREALEARGFRVWPAYATAGLEIDLMVEKQGKSLAIDLIGYPGAYGDAFELERCRILQRAGFELFALPFSSWCRSKERCLAALEKRIS